VFGALRLLLPLALASGAVAVSERASPASRNRALRRALAAALAVALLAHARAFTNGALCHDITSEVICPGVAGFGGNKVRSTKVPFR
jgi:hypothetical protein